MLEEQMTVPAEKEKEEKSKEKQTETVAKAYGLNLSEIEEVILPNGKEYFKFINPETRVVIMIENRRDGKNLSEQFKETQERLGSSQGNNEKANAKAIFDYIVKYNNIELTLIPVAELKHNKSAYKREIDALDMEKRNALRTLLENVERCEIQYINFENMIGIDKNNGVIQSKYNSQTGKCELVSAEVRNYETNTISADSDGYVFDVTAAEFDIFVESFEMADDEPVITEAYEINNPKNSTIRGREINYPFVLQAYKYPEILERGELSNVDKLIYLGIIAALRRKKEKAVGLNKNKQYVLNKKDDKNNQAAFVDSILLSLLLGFFSGMLISVIFLAIRMHI
jgi:hypothetical protein